MVFLIGLIFYPHTLLLPCQKKLIHIGEIRVSTEKTTGEKASLFDDFLTQRFCLFVLLNVAVWEMNLA